MASALPMLLKALHQNKKKEKGEERKTRRGALLLPSKEREREGEGGGRTPTAGGSANACPDRRTSHRATEKEGGEKEEKEGGLRGGLDLVLIARNRELALTVFLQGEKKKEKGGNRRRALTNHAGASTYDDLLVERVSTLEGKEKKGGKKKEKEGTRRSVGSNRRLYISSPTLRPPSHRPLKGRGGGKG